MDSTFSLDSVKFIMHGLVNNSRVHQKSLKKKNEKKRSTFM